LTTKIHMPCDTLGRPLRFPITPGQANDVTTAPDLLEGREAETVIPSRRNRKIAIPRDAEVYRHRNRIERCFNRFRHFHRFATRYDRRTIHFTGFVHLAAAIIRLR
jgi:putative transposase